MVEASPGEPTRDVARRELARRLEMIRADEGLRDDLRDLAGETTDDLGPIT